MKELKEKNKDFIRALNENDEYDEKEIEEVFAKYKNNIDVLDIIKYFMRHKYKLISQRDEYDRHCSDYEKIVERKSQKIQQQYEEIQELKEGIYELGENYRNLKKSYNNLKLRK